MSVLGKLSRSLGRRDEVPNQELAKAIVRSGNQKAIKELVENLQNKDRNIQSDCIKVLYEVGEQAPEMVSDYAEEFGRLLGRKNNRLVWGGMTALDAVAKENPGQVNDLLQSILAAADESGSVIARDHAVGILVKLAGNKKYATSAFPRLFEQLKKCPDNQFAMYAEMSVQVINEANKREFSKILEIRRNKLRKESQKKRIDKLIRKMN